jgi:hypothetical protein
VDGQTRKKHDGLKHVLLGSTEFHNRAKSGKKNMNTRDVKKRGERGKNARKYLHNENERKKGGRLDM